MVERVSALVHEYGGRVYKVGEKVVLEDPRHLAILLSFGRVKAEPGDLGYEEPSVVRRSKRAGSKRQ